MNPRFGANKSISYSYQPYGSAFFLNKVQRNVSDSITGIRLILSKNYEI